MTSHDINALVRVRVQLQSALRQIRTATNNPNLNDSEKVAKIKVTLEKFKVIIEE